MDIYETLTAEINQKVDKIIEDGEAFRLDILRKIEDARNNEILSALRTLNTRLNAIESRLPKEKDGV